ncbi:phosphate butyryltransferase [Clostridium sulfidigenes]|jgi:phosphate butyryltransferase|uniref:Phosphate butyryltransferase n=1 Tax=Clostridium sulfidigenes TaxID=318464 RepID=A0A084JAN2_9CLOT|nr:phosphate butyryltransferase [Clostridium sulfidigenes]KEZ86016.1 phosphate butyryltransferase [Clostridium sulfidigenes]HCO74250.1 phosphate butyryltransferase [Clostridium sp.]
MIKTFDEVISKVKSQSMKKVAVAVAQDEPVLEAIRDAKKNGIADAILVGDKEEIIKIAETIGMNIDEYEIIDEKDVNKASIETVKLVSSGRADMMMKGLVDTATFLRAVLNKEVGLRTGKQMSHIAIFEVPGYDRLLFVTDAAFNMYPELKEKIDIIKNAVQVAHALENNMPKVAPICAVEVVNPSMPATLDAANLSKMNERGQIKGCIIDGPLALDNALSKEAAAHKKISGPVAGEADILLMANIEAGNAVYKCLTYTTESKNGGLLMGAAAPVIVTSRADSPETKMNSIALASLVAGR